MLSLVKNTTGNAKSFVSFGLRCKEHPGHIITPSLKKNMSKGKTALQFLGTLLKKDDLTSYAASQRANRSKCTQS